MGVGSICLFTVKWVRLDHTLAVKHYLLTHGGLSVIHGRMEVTRPFYRERCLSLHVRASNVRVRSEFIHSTTNRQTLKAPMLEHTSHSIVERDS